MKTASLALTSHLAGELSTLATLVKITCIDGTVMGFTSHDASLTVDGVVYKADSAFDAHALESRQGLSTDNMEIAGMLDDAGIRESDIRAGKYDHARVDVFLCNWADVGQGVVHLRRGWIGEVVMKGGAYQAEIRGLHDLLQRTVGATFTPECRHKLGDAACGLSLSAMTVSGSVTSVMDSARFYDTARSEANGYFRYGLLTWTSGANAGRSMEVKDFSGTLFSLWLPLFEPITAGDHYTVTRGCEIGRAHV
jgi:uncharacterized phage protein (TIGR02218 family)